MFGIIALGLSLIGDHTALGGAFFRQTIDSNDLSLCGEPETKHTGYLNGLFYVFYESRRRDIIAEKIPLVIWLSGGPGCSSLVGMLFENGPCIVRQTSSTATLNAYSWTNAAHMIYIDQPRGTGFSPPRQSLGYNIENVTSRSMSWSCPFSCPSSYFIISHKYEYVLL